MTIGTVEFNPFNFLDPMNPFALIGAILLAGVFLILFCLTKNRLWKLFNGVLIVLLSFYYFVPYIWVDNMVFGQQAALDSIIIF